MIKRFRIPIMIITIIMMMASTVSATLDLKDYLLFEGYGTSSDPVEVISGGSSKTVTMTLFGTGNSNMQLNAPTTLTLKADGTHLFSGSQNVGTGSGSDSNKVTFNVSVIAEVGVTLGSKGPFDIKPAITLPVASAPGQQDMEWFTGAGSNPPFPASILIYVSIIAAPPTTYNVTFDFTGADFAPSVTYQIDSGTPVVITAGPTAIIPVPVGSDISYTYENVVYENDEITDNTRWVLNDVIPSSPINDIEEDVLIIGYYDTEFKVVFVSNPEINANVTYSIGLEPENDLDTPNFVWVPSGEEIEFEFENVIVDGGTKHVFVEANVLSPLTINSPITIVGDYDTYFKVTFIANYPIGARVDYQIDEELAMHDFTEFFIWVLSGSSLDYEFESVRPNGNLYLLESLTPTPPITIIDTIEVVGIYCYYEALTTAKSIGFWGNKNGEALIKDDWGDISGLLNQLNLVNEKGVPTDFTDGRLRPFTEFINVKGTAKNMSYMLSAQLAAFYLNDYFEFIPEDAVIFAPQLLNYEFVMDVYGLEIDQNGVVLARDLGEFADYLLAFEGNNITLAKHPMRALLEDVKNILEKANKNINIYGDKTCPTSSVPTILFSENFDEVTEGNIPDGWFSTHENWYVMTSTYADGTSSEMVFDWIPVISMGSSELISPVINATSKRDLELTFKHFVFHFINEYDLQVMVSTNNGVTWSTVWSITPTSDVGPATVTVDLSAYDGQTFILAWMFEGNSYNINFWYIDDIVVTGIQE